MLGRNNALVFRARAGHDVSPIQKELLWQAQLCVFPLLTLRSHSSPPSLSGKCLQMNELFCRCASHFIKPPTVLHLFVRQTSASSRGQLVRLLTSVFCCRHRGLLFRSLRLFPADSWRRLGLGAREMVPIYRLVGTVVNSAFLSWQLHIKSHYLLFFNVLIQFK